MSLGFRRSSKHGLNDDLVSRCFGNFFQEGPLPFTKYFRDITVFSHLKNMLLKKNLYFHVSILIDCNRFNGKYIKKVFSERFPIVVQCVPPNRYDNLFKNRNDLKKFRAS